MLQLINLKLSMVSLFATSSMCLLPRHGPVFAVCVCLCVFVCLCVCVHARVMCRLSAPPPLPPPPLWPQPR